jgi:hypothetical protein
MIISPGLNFSPSSEEAFKVFGVKTPLIVIRITKKKEDKNLILIILTQKIERALKSDCKSKYYDLKKKLKAGYF